MAARLVLAGHVARRTWISLRHGERRWRDAARSAVADAVLFEMATRAFGPDCAIRLRQGLFPHVFMPDYYGLHFQEAVRRALFPGHGPNIVYFSITGRCPCACTYCFAGAGPQAGAGLPDDTLLRVAEALAHERVPLVNISGGEPLTRYAQLVRVIEILAHASEVRLFTTGFGLSERRLDTLVAAGLKGIFVSLDTPDATAFDRARGKTGAFKAAVTALRLAAERDVLTFVNCVVSRNAFATEDEIVRFLRFVESIDARIVVNFLPQLATGRGAQSDSFAAPAECEAVAERLLSTAAKLDRPITMLFGRIDTVMGCVGAGGKLLNVDIAGNVTVCISGGVLGNLLQEPFHDVYQRFVQHCVRLKVGFFCTRVAEQSGATRIERSETQRALQDFYEHAPDADWQRVLDRYGRLLALLYRDEPIRPTP